MEADQGGDAPLARAVLSGRQAQRLGQAARAAATRAPQSLTVARYRAQPAVLTIVRLTSTAILAYVFALQLPGTTHPVLAPLTALLVMQVSVYQTLRSAAHRITAVLVGVLLAVGLSAWVGFTWWTLGITVALALAIGYVLHLGDTILEVPISAMLILSVATVRSAADTRVIETMVGAAAGLLAGLFWARPQTQSAEEAIEDSADKMASLLEQMAAGLRAGSVRESAADWLARGRALSAEIRRVDDALRHSEESVRLNPRAAMLLPPRYDLRYQLEPLEHAAITVRSLARSLADSAWLTHGTSVVRDREVQVRLAGTLEELADAVRTFGRLAQVHHRPDRERLVTEMQAQLLLAQKRQNELSEVMGIDPAVHPVGWPLRGEIVSHLDRLRKTLEAGVPGGHRQQQGRARHWRLPQQRRRRGAVSKSQ
jgi:uncharacterized membrane protein YgaE (UPF0421/DUF939 family)